MYILKQIIPQKSSLSESCIFGYTGGRPDLLIMFFRLYLGFIPYFPFWIWNRQPASRQILSFTRTEKILPVWLADEENLYLQKSSTHGYRSGRKNWIKLSDIFVFWLPASEKQNITRLFLPYPVEYLL